MAITGWRHYADPGVAPLCRSWNGSIWAIINTDNGTQSSECLIRFTAAFDMPKMTTTQSSLPDFLHIRPPLANAVFFG